MLWNTADLDFPSAPLGASTADRIAMSGPSLRTFERIADEWGLSERERLAVLGCPPRSTYHGWRHSAARERPITLSLDTLLRISAVLGIHKALVILHATATERVGWLRGPHRATVFGGNPPMALVVSGTQDGLMVVRRFLDAARGGIYMEPNEADADFQADTDEAVVFL